MSYKKITNRVSVVDDDTGFKQTVDRNGHADIVAHSHPEGGSIHLVTGDVSVDTDFIIVDISDTVNYPHENTGTAHIAWTGFSMDASNTAAYTLRFGFVENVDGTDGDFHEVHSIIAERDSSIPLFNLYAVNPEGIFAKTSKCASSVKSLNDTAFNTATNMRTTLSPSVAATPPGHGDLILRVEVNTGSVNVTFDLNYHSHNL